MPGIGERHGFPHLVDVCTHYRGLSLGATRGSRPSSVSAPFTSQPVSGGARSDAQVLGSMANAQTMTQRRSIGLLIDIDFFI